MARAFDEPDAVYGLVARSAVLAPDGHVDQVQPAPRGEICRWHAITADDVVFSFKTLKEKGHPQFRLSLRDVVEAVAHGPLTVRFEFKGNQTRDLPQIVATLPILSSAFYTAAALRPSSLEPPLGSGPYAIGDFKQGTFVSYKRRADYWAKDLPVNRGRFNFDEVRYEYFRDRTPTRRLEGGAFDFREEFTAMDWTTGYDVAAVKEGRLIRLDPARPTSVRGAGVLHQYAAGKVHRPARAQGAQLCLRLRVDEPQSFL